MITEPKLSRFNQYVLSKFQIYNSIFITLPFDNIGDTGVLLPLFKQVCEAGLAKGKDPKQILNYFFEKYDDNPTEEERINLMFRFIQYIERQVVLFDAVEDAAFPVVNNMDGIGTLRSTKEIAFERNKKEALQQYLEDFKVRVVLTAHPTQFYPGSVLGIITDLTSAIEKNDLTGIKKLLAQLGKTPFLKDDKPTPLDEAISLTWFLENVFYYSVSNIYQYIKNNIYENKEIDNEIISIGFWPGGDRDGNPFVTTEITLQVANRLRNAALRNYYRDIRRLKRRLTFKNVEPVVIEIENKLYQSFTNPYQEPLISLEDLSNKLTGIRKLIIEKHQSLFLPELDDLIYKVRLFGYHFAALDIRQDSRIHNQILQSIAAARPGLLPENYFELSSPERIKALEKVSGDLEADSFADELTKNTLGSVRAIRQIQEMNGEKGSNRYIISNNQSALNVYEVFALFRLTGYGQELPIDIVPLFETINDLTNAETVMAELYNSPGYKKHLKLRGNKQVVMLGFSDGTKDGGYLKANWAIYLAKERLTEISRKNNIKIIFFDGRGGPPARGGGKTHQFYASLGPDIESEEIQLTIQGQTISSNFGTIDSSQYNLEQLISSGISNQILEGSKNRLSPEEKILLNDLADLSYRAYEDFKNNPKFLPYLENVSTLNYYSKTNIGSRPSKRGKSSELVFTDLRAIPFVGSWSQLKQNVPGFYGVGAALKKYEENGRFDELIALYNNSKFFRSLIENSMMAMKKSNFDLTRYMKDDPEYGDFWQLIYDEFMTAKRLTLKLANHRELMENYPEGKASVEIRESIVLPLLTIQQNALMRLNELRGEQKKNEKLIEVYETIVTRSLFGNINASRNSA
jgi:phosphoenolpyruvate carboxylase